MCLSLLWGSLCPHEHKDFCEPSEYLLAGMCSVSKCDFAPPTISLASLWPFDVGYRFLVGPNILLSIVVQQQAAVLGVLTGDMSARPSTP